MARESRSKQTAATIQTFANQLREFAVSLDAVATAMPALGLKEIETTHATAIVLGMRNVDGFCAAARDALRTANAGPIKSNVKTKKRVRLPNSGHGK